jgi:hypothetical protein
VANLPTITITQEQYNQLLDDQAFLGALRAAGVDNWSGYDDAIDLYHEAKGEDDDE